MADPISNKGFGDSALAERVSEAYTKRLDLSPLSKNEWWDLGIEDRFIQPLESVLALYSHGDYIITGMEADRLIEHGFSDEFVRALRGDDGKKVLRKRIRWMADSAETKWWRWDLDKSERFLMLDVLRKDMKRIRFFSDISQIVAEETLPILASIIRNDPDKEICEEAGFVLAETGCGTAGAVEDIIAAFHEKKLSPHWVAQILASIGKPAVPALVGMIRTYRLETPVNSNVDDWPFNALLGMRGEEGIGAIPELLLCLKNRNKNIRFKAIYTLNFIMAPRSSEMVSAILPLLEDKETWPNGVAAKLILYFTITLLERLAGQANAYLALPLLAGIRDDPAEEEKIRARARDAIQKIESKVL